MKSIILYCAGGLTNRIFPIASAKHFAKQAGRKLLIYWPLDFRCDGHFGSLYDDDLEFIDESFLLNLNDDETEYLVVYPETVANDASVYGRSFLADKNARGLIQYRKSPPIDSETENILFCTNNFFGDIDASRECLLNMKIKPSIIEEANLIATELQLDKTVLGVHARGTDFNMSQEQYMWEIKQFNHYRVFICSDDELLESELYIQTRDCLEKSPIIRHKEYVVKNNLSRPEWSGNAYTSSNALREAVIDLILLSKTDLRVIHKHSAYAQYARILAEGSFQ